MIPTLQLGGMGLRRNAVATTGRRFWRLSISANNGDATYTTVQEVEFRLVASGADVTTTTTPVVASTVLAGYPGELTVDNDTTNDQKVWNAAASAAFPHTLTYDLGADTSVAEVAIWAQNNAGTTARAPKDFLIQSGPASAGPWTTERTVTAQTAWTAGSVRAFSIP